MGFRTKPYPPATPVIDVKKLNILSYCRFNYLEATQNAEVSKIPSGCACSHIITASAVSSPGEAAVTFFGIVVSIGTICYSFPFSFNCQDTVGI